jgi:hypothetical protein
MDDQRGALDRSVHQLVEPPGSGSGAGVDQASNFALSPLFGSPVSGKEISMSQMEPFEEAPAASLVGSLAVFSLSEVLTLLATTVQTGELQVVSEDVDGKLWLDRGELSNAHVGSASTIGQAVFELACVTDGWFYFTEGVTSSSGQPTAPVAAVLIEVQPQVDEWREIRTVVPLEAIVTLSPVPPGQDVQIRNDQWQVLTTVGNAGHSVRSVLEMIGGDQIVGLRTLRDLQTAGLIVMVSPGAVDPEPMAAPTEAVESGSATLLGATPTVAEESAADDAGVPAPPGLDAVVGTADERFGDLADVTIMPPPIASDPWSPAVETNGAATAAGENGVA